MEVCWLLFLFLGKIDLGQKQHTWVQGVSAFSKYDEGLGGSGVKKIRRPLFLYECYEL